jgi:hypothetical protein
VPLDPGTVDALHGAGVVWPESSTQEVTDE